MTPEESRIPVWDKQSKVGPQWQPVPPSSSPRERGKNMMTVRELIDALKKCPPDLPVYTFEDNDIKPIFEVDNTLSDRVDLNIYDE